MLILLSRLRYPTSSVVVIAARLLCVDSHPKPTSRPTSMPTAMGGEPGPLCQPTSMPTSIRHLHIVSTNAFFFFSLAFFSLLGSAKATAVTVPVPVLPVLVLDLHAYELQ